MIIISLTQKMELLYSSYNTPMNTAGHNYGHLKDKNLGQRLNKQGRAVTFRPFNDLFK